MTAWQTPKPLPIPLAMSTSASEPSGTKQELPSSTAIGPASASATPISPRLSTEGNHRRNSDSNHDSEKDKHSNIPTPKLRLEIRDLEHDGARRFLKEVRAGVAVQDAIRTVLHLLYDCTGTTINCPSVRSITFILRSMDGVAYTTGNDLDDEHKEIHLSLDYINHQDANRFRHETLGVLVHEMVHVWQWNSLRGDVPGGLIEGIADFVRLRAGYAPPHWNREPPAQWDAGYEKTGFFLDWLEDVYGAGKIVELNGQLRNDQYDEKKIWKHVFDRNVDELFKAYCDDWKKRKGLLNQEKHSI